MRLYVLSSVLWHPLWCPHQNDVRFVFTSSCCSRRAHVLFTLFVLDCVKWCPTYIVLCFCFVFLRLVYPMLSVSLDCPFLFAPSVISNVYWQDVHRRHLFQVTSKSYVLYNILLPPLLQTLGLLWKESVLAHSIWNVIPIMWDKSIKHKIMINLLIL